MSTMKGSATGCKLQATSYKPQAASFKLEPAACSLQPDVQPAARFAACSLRPAACSRRGAHAVEYAMLIGIVVAAMVAMQTYVRRAIQAHLKNVELRLNGQ